MRIDVLYASLLALACATVGATASAAEGMSAKGHADVRQTIQSWPADAKKAAEMTLQKYGEPDEVTPERLVWNGNGPWKRTIITREETDHAFPMPHKDVMQQVIDYKVPPEKFDDLAQYDGSVIVERTKGEISARCDKEEANFLALNLANDVATGKKSVQEAREYYARAIKDLMAGKKDPYVQKLQFSPQQRTADADRPAPMRQAMEKASP
jgi:hypothetical protein